MNFEKLISTCSSISKVYKCSGQEIEVRGISHDSRALKEGDVFVALSGDNFDGHQYIEDAHKKGAVVVVGEQAIPSIPIPYIQVEDSRLALAQLSAAFYEFPAKKLTVIGVTGTDGKTTTVSLLHHILFSCGIEAGMVSTVKALIGKESVDTGFHVTTPEAQLIQSLLRRMVDRKLTHVVLEATSHGLEQMRVAECYFDIGVVTNITHEHLDYHGDYDHYLKAKAKLFTGLTHGAIKEKSNYGIAILNSDDISYQPLKEILSVPEYQDIRIYRYGTGSDCDLSAENISNTMEGIIFDIVFGNKRYHVESSLIGEYNVFNILAAVGAAVNALRLPIDDVIHAVGTFEGVPGRMEQIDLGQDFQAIVDFAHTPNALKVALETSRKRTEKRVIAVFGSAGLRDKEKRRMMAATSIQIADFTILTAEDPRTETLSDILSEMNDEAQKRGGILGDTFLCVEDRGEAIRKAVSIAGEGDMVIVCGKGHEQSMCFGATEYPWDDRIALRAALSEHLGLSGYAMPYLPTQNP